MLGCEETGVAGDRPVGAAAAAGEQAEARAQDTAGTGSLGSGQADTRCLRLGAAYARVSTEKQEREQTIQSQLDALRRVAGESGLEIPPEWYFTDDGYSGALLDRPGLDRLRDLASEGAIEAVLVCSPDRLAREYAYQVLVIEELQRAGCELVFLNHAYGDSPEERMLLQMQGVFAEYERALIKERARRGRLFAARQGRLNWCNPPYGYRLIRKTEHAPQQLLVDETEAEVVRSMYRWLTEEGLSSYAIEKRLHEMGTPTRTSNERGWCQSTVIEILRDPMYKGEGYYNRTVAVDAKRPRMGRGYKDLRPGNGRSRAARPREEWIQVRVPAIVDDQTWELAQVQLLRNKERATRNNTKHQYLLRSLLVCGVCERRMIGTWNKYGGRYVCSARYPRHEPWSCNGRSVVARRLEPQVWEYVSRLLSDSDLLRERYEAGRADPAVEPREEQEQERLRRKIGALEREVQRLIDAYQAGVIELEELSERRGCIHEHGRMLRERLLELGKQRADREQQIRLLQGVDEFCESVRGALVEPSFETKQQVLRLVVDRIVVEDSKVIIHHVVPTATVRLQTEYQLDKKRR